MPQTVESAVFFAGAVAMPVSFQSRCNEWCKQEMAAKRAVHAASDKPLLRPLPAFLVSHFCFCFQKRIVCCPLRNGSSLRVASRRRCHTRGNGVHAQCRRVRGSVQGNHLTARGAAEQVCVCVCARAHAYSIVCWRCHLRVAYGGACACASSSRGWVKKKSTTMLLK